MWSPQPTPSLSTPTSGFTSSGCSWLGLEDFCDDHRSRRAGDTGDNALDQIVSFLDSPQDATSEEWLSRLESQMKLTPPSDHGLALGIANANTENVAKEPQTQKKEGEEEEEEQQQQPSRSAPRATVRLKKRALLGKVYRLLSRSTLSNAEPAPSAPPSDACPVATGAVEESPTLRKPWAEDKPRLHSQVPEMSGAASVATERDGRRPGRAENFHVALDNHVFRLAFGKFCERTLSAENVEFVRQVRQLERLSAAEGTTASDLRTKLGDLADSFVRPKSAAEINVEGAIREDVLCSIEAALEAAPWDGALDGGDSPWGWVSAIAATEALGELAREVHPLIFDGLWPRFLGSEEFASMMKTEEMRTVGFRDLDGRLVVGESQPQLELWSTTKQRRRSLTFSSAAAHDKGESAQASPAATSTSSSPLSSLDASCTGASVDAVAARSPMASTTTRIGSRRRASFRLSREGGRSLSFRLPLGGTLFGGRLWTRWGHRGGSPDAEPPLSAVHPSSPMNSIIEGSFPMLRRSVSLR